MNRKIRLKTKRLRAEIKKAVKGTAAYELLKKVDRLISEKSDLGKKIKAEEKELKEAVYERILVLTEEEIDALIFEKWFGTTVADFVKLVEIPLKKELSTLEMLNKRYANTLSEMDDEINKLESNFEALMGELVVM